LSKLNHWTTAIQFRHLTLAGVSTLPLYFEACVAITMTLSGVSKCVPAFYRGPVQRNTSVDQRVPYADVAQFSYPEAPGSEESRRRRRQAQPQRYRALTGCAGGPGEDEAHQRRL
jgi:hypothetical protein